LLRFSLLLTTNGVNQSALPDRSLASPDNAAFFFEWSRRHLYV
jgi:hypothetical protein